ncbi:hypothetical protein PoB_003069200 [Plakobranchus ocellatus]|uniref:Uncharacterized protein n=1 Tax=Plakobranchus ocellatus TaxID=259542 RepID=A0AAV4AB15_9GAST|nr:hypothetical protein PoB_003069200 [Plakobranchus ocellatus]
MLTRRYVWEEQPNTEQGASLALGLAADASQTEADENLTARNSHSNILTWSIPRLLTKMLYRTGQCNLLRLLRLVLPALRASSCAPMCLHQVVGEERSPSSHSTISRMPPSTPGNN